MQLVSAIGINCLPSRFYGEVEFRLSTMKVVTVIAICMPRSDWLTLTALIAGSFSGDELGIRSRCRCRRVGISIIGCQLFLSANFSQLYRLQELVPTFLWLLSRNRWTQGAVPRVLGSYNAGLLLLLRLGNRWDCMFLFWSRSWAVYSMIG